VAARVEMQRALPLARYLRQSVAEGINGMSHQHTDAQNEEVPTAAESRGGSLV
jgi:hypothetical protein